MVAPALAKWGGVLGWAGLHAVGGVIGGVIGVILVSALNLPWNPNTDDKNQSMGK